MLKNLFFVLCIIIVGVSCLKSGERTCAYPVITMTAPQSEQDSIVAYLDSNNIEAEHHPSGFYYKIITPGEGVDTLSLCSEILIDFKGELQNGQVIEAGTNVYLVLGAMIEGWKKGIPLIKRGGEIKLYIPPLLGYGYEAIQKQYDNATVVVPGKSVLIYTIKLKDYSPGF